MARSSTFLSCRRKTPNDVDPTSPAQYSSTTVISRSRVEVETQQGGFRETKQKCFARCFSAHPAEYFTQAPRAEYFVSFPLEFRPSQVGWAPLDEIRLD